MRKNGDRDFLTVLQSLETILQAQTKISKQKKTSNQAQNSKSSTPLKKSNKKKTNKTEAPKTSIKTEIQRLTRYTPSPKLPRKLYKNGSKEHENNINYSNDIIQTPKKYSSRKSSATPKAQRKTLHHQSPIEGADYSIYSRSFSPSSPTKHRVRHNSPSEPIYNENDERNFRSNYTPSQLNTLCIFFLRWMKKCTEKIESEGKIRRKSESDQLLKTIESVETTEPNDKSADHDNKELPSNGITKLTEANTISIERVDCNLNPNDQNESNQKFIDNDIIITSTTLQSNSSINNSNNSHNSTNKRKSSSSRVSFSPMLTPQQQKQYLDYLQPNHNYSQGNSPISNPRHIKRKMEKANINNNHKNNKPNTNIINDNKNDNNNKNEINSSNNNNNKDTGINNTENNNEDDNSNNHNSNSLGIKDDNKLINSNNDNNNSANDIVNNNNDTNNTNTKLQNNNTDKSNINSSNESTEEISKLDLERTSPLPIPNDIKKMPSIGESDLNNQPNSDEIHYDSYELSEKSLSLLPPQGEGEVTEFNPSNFM